MGRKLLIVVLALGLLVGGFIFFPLPKMAHIQLPAEKVADIGGFPVLNSMVATWITMILLVILSWAGTRGIREVPGRLQGLLELVVEMLVGLCESVAGYQLGRKFFTVVATIFLFVLFNNWLGLLPLFGSLEIREPEPVKVEAAKPAAEEHVATTTTAETGATPAAQGEHETGPIMVPLLRSSSTDLNTTIALALVSVLLTQVYGVQALGFGSYMTKFINIKGGFVGIFVGLLEAIGEIARILSFSFRLFGNVFAGEVLLATMVFLIPWVVAVPFMGLELFVGLIQALIFAMLTLIFMTMATVPHGGHSEGHH